MILVAKRLTKLVGNSVIFVLVLGNFTSPNPLKENGKRYSPFAIRAAGLTLRNLGDFDAWIVGQPFIYHRFQVLDFIAFENLDLPHRLLP